MKTKGQRIVSFTTSLLAEMCIEGGEHHFKCTAGLPADANVVRAFQKPSNGLVGEECILFVVVESSEWEQMEEGSMIPILMPSFERIETCG